MDMVVAAPMDGLVRRQSSASEDACWVCLEGPSPSAGVLEHPCACPRGVHAKCLARWQLQSAGRDEECHCRFCKHELPDWRDILSPKVPSAPPVMAIVYDGKVVRLQVKPGKEGMEEFQRQVRQAFNLGEDVELDCVFDCRAPGTGEKIKLRGLESYSAAMHCAAVAAGERLAKMKTARPALPASAAAAAPPPPGTAVAAGATPSPGASSRTVVSPDLSGSTASSASSRQTSLPQQQATCGLPISHHHGPHVEGEACGGGGSSPGASAGGSRRRNLLSELFKSLASAKRIT
ncbi:hypothetical protein TSOC_001276 [Tetrabaena socialis]|uniref:RING-CH-type domain-containing protein n=1 Tax=Tetrabaena socialis TaxID=47790 RepID=A0A2J8AH74_9CHLO|nr:hypothetical protein TSOC_001276 [Tetrabaena socialis]|eukprot:PNH11841.1 hypothetical protein TSOC_001276 [Tetrabaena socialis]